jgi:hypothetical protein
VFAPDQLATQQQLQAATPECQGDTILIKGRCCAPGSVCNGGCCAVLCQLVAAVRSWHGLNESNGCVSGNCCDSMESTSAGHTTAYTLFVSSKWLGHTSGWCTKPHGMQLFQGPQLLLLTWLASPFCC